MSNPLPRPRRANDAQFEKQAAERHLGANAMFDENALFWEPMLRPFRAADDTIQRRQRLAFIVPEMVLLTILATIALCLNTENKNYVKFAVSACIIIVSLAILVGVKLKVPLQVLDGAVLATLLAGTTASYASTTDFTVDLIPMSFLSILLPVTLGITGPWAMLNCVVHTLLLIGFLASGIHTGRIDSADGGLAIAFTLIASLQFLIRVKATGALMQKLRHGIEKVSAEERFVEDMQNYLFHEVRNPLVTIEYTLRLAIDGNVAPISANAKEAIAPSKSPMSRNTLPSISGSEEISVDTVFRNALDQAMGISKLLFDVQEVMRLRKHTTLFERERVGVGQVLWPVVEKSFRGPVNRTSIVVSAPVFTWIDKRSDTRGCEVYVLSDSMAMEKIFMYVISNALKFSDSRVEVVTSLVSDPGSRGKKKTSCCGPRKADTDDVTDWVEISVTNDGQCIPADQLERCFGLFQVQSHRRKGGSGLGLVECKLLCDGIGALLDVTSADRQTTVRIRLPLQEHAVVEGKEDTAADEKEHVDDDVPSNPLAASSLSDVREAERERLRDVVQRADGVARMYYSNEELQKETEPSTGSNITSASAGEWATKVVQKPDSVGKPTSRVSSDGVRVMEAGLSHKATGVLFVDDVPMNRVVGKSLLQQSPAGRAGQLCIDVAEDGRAAVDMVRQKMEEGTPYAIIYMDITMPVMNGWEATEAIRVLETVSETYQKSKIVAVTGNTLPADVERCLDVGMDEVFFKPYRIEQLYSVLPVVSQ